MFEKLISLAPYNPSLAHQLAFYSRRMREESAIRRTGLIFMVLAFFIQFFAVISPPQPTVAASTNDLVSNGFTTRAQAVHYCDTNLNHYREVLNYYGIKCASLGNAATVSLSSRAFSDQLYSVGYNPQGARNNTTHRVTNEVAQHPTGARPVYWRLLDSWGTTRYQALKVTNSAGKVFFVLYGCGNLTTVGVPKHVTLTAVGKPRTINLPPQTVKIPKAPACKYNQNLPASSPRCVAPCQYNSALAASSPKCFQPCKYNASIPASSQDCFQKCKYNKNIPSTSKDCFQHCTLPGKTTLPINSPQCAAPCPYNNTLPASSPQCFQPCQYNKTLPVDSPDCVPPCQFNSGISSTDSRCFQPCKYNSSLPADSPQCFQPCVFNSAISSSDEQCKPCEKSTSVDDVAACAVLHKTAENITTGATDANNTTANPDDVIHYTLSAQNSGQATLKAFVFQENLSDVLDYADATELHGGTIDDNKVVTWPAVDIGAGQTVSQQITVKVKNPVPQTPSDPADPNHFDLVMTNVYGDTINISLPGSPAKTVETAAATLPNTGPGTGLFIAAVLVVAGGYFYARSRLLQEESTIAVQELASA